MFSSFLFHASYMKLYFSVGDCFVVICAAFCGDNVHIVRASYNEVGAYIYRRCDFLPHPFFWPSM